MTSQPARTPLGATLIRSSMWMLLNSAFIKLVTFLTQIVLSTILAKEDFGVYAIALSVSALLTNLRGAGMGQWLIQGGKENFSQRAGHAFWTSVAFNAFLGVVIVAIAYPAGSFFENSQVPLVLLISGASFPLLSLGEYFKNVMAIDLRMRDITTIEIASSLVRYGLMLGLAIAGFGPLSFVIPLPFSYVLEAAMGYAFTRDQAWRRSSRARDWGPLILRNRWIMIGTFVITISLQADYFVLGKLAPLSVLGVYYFAYQMTYMSAALVTENVRRVLFPGLVTVPAERRAAAALQASTICTVLGAPLLMVIAAVIGPLEDLIWSGKWADAVLPIQLLSIGLPLQLMTSVTQSSLQSDGRFRLWSGVNLIRAVCVVIGATTAGLLFPDDIDRITAVIATSLAIANGTQVWIAYKVQGIKLGTVLAESVSPLVIAPAALLATLALGDSVTVGSMTQVVFNLLCFFVLWVALSAMLARKELRLAASSLRSALTR